MTPNSICTTLGLVASIKRRSMIKSNELSLVVYLVVTLVSSNVIINSIDYLSIDESYLFLVYTYLLQSLMNLSILSQDLAISHCG